MLRFCDYLAIVFIGIIIVIFPFTTTCGLLEGLLYLIVVLAMTIPVCAWLCGWKRRYRSHKERERLLALPRKTVYGMIPYVSPHARKVIYHANPTGSTIGTNGETYIHYGPSIPEAIIDYYQSNMYLGNNAYLSIRTLPTDFSDKITETIPESTIAHFTVTYVTDSDGVNYFVSASQS